MTTLLTIGELADRTGVAPATLRMWEQRHGFPEPERLPSGHRRYHDADVARVAEVVRRRDSGTRLDVAIEAARGREAPPEAGPSVFADLRERHPHLQVHRLHKSTLTALSWAIEDEFCAQARRPRLFGAFQRQEFYAPSRSRWAALARLSASSIVFVDRPGPPGLRGLPDEVVLPEDAPLCREWVVVCDAVELPAALAAWEIPGQDDVPDRQRLFEAIWTVEPVAVRDAARACAAIAHEHGSVLAARALFDLAEPVVPRAADLAAVTTLFNRVVAYVDGARR